MSWVFQIGSSRCKTLLSDMALPQATDKRCANPPHLQGHKACIVDDQSSGTWGAQAQRGRANIKARQGNPLGKRGIPLGKTGIPLGKRGTPLGKSIPLGKTAPSRKDAHAYCIYLSDSWGSSMMVLSFVWKCCRCLRSRVIFDILSPQKW